MENKNCFECLGYDDSCTRYIKVESDEDFTCVHRIIADKDLENYRITNCFDDITYKDMLQTYLENTREEKELYRSIDDLVGDEE